MQLLDVLIEADTDLDWCTDPSELERALVRLVELESCDDVTSHFRRSWPHPSWRESSVA
jgi:hypothetical protein